MNQMSEGVSEGESGEGNTVHIIEEYFSVHTMKYDENQFLGAWLETASRRILQENGHPTPNRNNTKENIQFWFPN